MSIELRFMSHELLGLWIQRVSREYEQSRLKAGDPTDVARDKARASMETSFPNGVPAPGHLVYDVITNEPDTSAKVVGYLWIAPTRESSTDWWVFDIEIDEPHRSNGFGRAAMQLAEKAAADHGAATIGLNVFGYNTTARKLYESLGYQTTSVQMRKSVQVTSTA